MTTAVTNTHTLASWNSRREDVCNIRVPEGRFMIPPFGLMLLLLSIACESNGSTFNCSSEYFQQCMIALQEVTQREKLAFATTKEELQEVCQQLKDAIRCVDGHSEKCFSVPQRQVFNSVVSGSRQVIEDLCVPGHIQERYLKYSKCFKNVSTDERKCADKYHRIVDLSEESEIESKSVEEGLKETCCAFTEFVHCKYTHVVEDCGQEAGVFLQQHSDRMSNSLIHQHCAQYTYGSSSCEKGCSSSINGKSGIVFTPLLWMAFYCIK